MAEKETLYPYRKKVACRSMCNLIDNYMYYLLPQSGKPENTDAYFITGKNISHEVP